MDGGNNGTLGTIPAARRAGSSSGMIPSTWTGRGVVVEYVSATGEAQSLSAKLLDTCPVGVVLGANGGRFLLAWNRLCLLELRDG